MGQFPNRSLGVGVKEPGKWIPSIGGCAHAIWWLEASCICIIGDGLCCPFLRTFSRYENFALCHSWWINLQHLLPASALSEVTWSLLLPCHGHQCPPGSCHDDFGASTEHPLLLVDFWHQMLYH